jgi:hypothetical protein
MRQELVSHFVSHILENLFLSFSGETLGRIQALQDPEASTQACHFLNEIRQQRENGEGE